MVLLCDLSQMIGLGVSAEKKVETQFYGIWICFVSLPKKSITGLSVEF